MPVKLHRCSATWFKGPHSCWKVQKALDNAGIEYEVVKEPLRRSKRSTTREKTGQKLYPWLELDDGRVLREESAQLAERIRAGRLLEPPPAA
jgi:glutathione S-transferase